MTESQHPSQHQPEQSQLGKTSSYADQYDPSLLFPLPRATSRAEIGVTGAPRWATVGGLAPTTQVARSTSTGSSTGCHDGGTVSAKQASFCLVTV